MLDGILVGMLLLAVIVDVLLYKQVKKDGG